MHLKISSMKRWPFCPGERWVKPLSSGGQCTADSMAAENLSLQGDKSAVVIAFTWWRHQMETFSALLAIFTGEFPAQRPGTPALMFSLIYAWINGLSKQPSGRWFKTPLRSLWSHCNGYTGLHTLRAKIDSQPTSLHKQHLVCWNMMPLILEQNHWSSANIFVNSILL